MSVLLALAFPASAADLLFVLHDSGTIESYDANGASRGAVQLSGGNTASDLAVSPGGRWIYASDRWAGMHWIDPVTRSTSQGSTLAVNTGGRLAVSADRATLFYAAYHLYTYDAGNLTYLARPVSSVGMSNIAASPTDTVLLADETHAPANPYLVSYDTTNFANPSTLDTPPDLIHDVQLTTDGRHSLATFEENGDLVVVSCDTSGCGQATVVAGSGDGGELAASHAGEFYVASQAGVSSFYAVSNAIAPGPVFGDPNPRDIAVGQNDEVYVLYDDHLDRFDHIGDNQTRLATFTDGEFRWEIVTAASRTSLGLCASNLCARAHLAELVAEVRFRQIVIPWWGARRDLDCSRCSGAEREAGRADARAFLDARRYGKGSVLEVADVVDFLQESWDLSEADAQWALDSELIRIATKK